MIAATKHPYGNHDGVLTLYSWTTGMVGSRRHTTVIYRDEAKGEAHIVALLADAPGFEVRPFPDGWAELVDGMVDELHGERIGIFILGEDGIAIETRYIKRGDDE